MQMLQQVKPWQREQWDFLQQARDSNHLPHALMFCGHAGLGKMDFAIAFAHTLLCERGNACGLCGACDLLQSGNHPDLFIVTPDDPDKPTLKIEQIRQLMDALTQTSHHGGYQVVVLKPLEGLSIGASNALLKMIEEPMGKIVFILITEQPGTVLATVRSRCQRVTFGAARFDDAVTYFKVAGIPPEQHALLYQLCDGAPLQALQLSENGVLAQRQRFFSALQGLIRGTVEPVFVADQFQSIPLLSLLDWLSRYLQDSILLAYGAHEYVVNKDHQAILVATDNKSALDAIYAQLDNLQMVRNLLVRGSNLNNLMLLEEVLIKLVHFTKRFGIQV